MPAKGQKHTPEALARISEGTRRGQRPWKNALRVVPSNLRAFIQRGQCSRELRAAVNEATSVVAAYAEQLGGAENLSPAQRVMLSKLWKSQVVTCAAFEAYLGSGDPKALEGMSTWLLEERNVLTTLGLTTVEPEKAIDLSSYLREREARAEKRQAESAPVDVTPEPEAHAGDADPSSAPPPAGEPEPEP